MRISKVSSLGRCTFPSESLAGTATVPDAVAGGALKNLKNWFRID